MKKIKIYSLMAFVSTSAAAYAQVGIHTANPASSLDVMAKNATGTSKNVDGLLIPRVDRERAQSMTSVPVSTMIYINSISTGTQTGTAAKIDTVGHYYFDGTVWQKFVSSGIDPRTVDNIYHNDGTLEGNRTVTQADKTLTFKGTKVNAFSVDDSSLSVDASNHRVGIGTTSPDNKLHVVATSSSGGRYNLVDATEGTGGEAILTLRNTSPLATGNLSILGFNNAGPTAFGANWGIGSTRNDATSDANQEDFVFLHSTGGSYKERMRVKSNGNVGIGTGAPTNVLHVKAGSDPLKLEGVGAGGSSDKSLVIDGNGVVKTVPSADDQAIPTPTLLTLKDDVNNFLNGKDIGESQVVSMQMLKNKIPGLTYTASDHNISFPAGTYQITMVYEATHNTSGCTLSSYFFDFPNGARVHSTASHNQGGTSNHGGSITYAVKLPNGGNLTTLLGRGQSGNCKGPGMTLRGGSTQLLIFRLGS